VEIVGLRHAGITVEVMDDSLAFYRDGLGLQVVLDTVRDALYQHAVLALPYREIRMALLDIPGSPGCQIELLEFRGAERMPARARPSDPAAGHLCLEVRDVAVALARLSGLGYRSRSEDVVPIEVGANAGGRLVYVADPDGYWIELLERPATPEVG
jgi:catechol 2,3-dioxygenase-like lactoylglutathione lyase family enzyme